MNINHVQRLAWPSLKGNDMVGSAAKDHSRMGANFIPCMSMIARTYEVHLVKWNASKEG